MLIEKLIVYTDASVRQDCTGLGLAIRSAKGKLIEWRGKAAPIMTNNEAEYTAIIFALEHALRYAPLELQVMSDSQVAINQLCGECAVRDERLQPLNQRAVHLAGRFQKVTFQYIPRKQNYLADAIANVASLTGVEQN